MTAVNWVSGAYPTFFQISSKHIGKFLKAQIALVIQQYFHLPDGMHVTNGVQLPYNDPVINVSISHLKAKWFLTSISLAYRYPLGNQPFQRCCGRVSVQSYRRRGMALSCRLWLMTPPNYFHCAGKLSWCVQNANDSLGVHSICSCPPFLPATLLAHYTFVGCFRIYCKYFLIQSVMLVRYASG